MNIRRITSVGIVEVTDFKRLGLFYAPTANALPVKYEYPLVE